MKTSFIKKFLNILNNLLDWKDFESLGEQRVTKYVLVKFMWSNNVLLSIICFLLEEQKEKNLEKKEEILINSDINFDESFSVVSFISNYSTSFFIISLVILLSFGICYHQGYFFNSPYIFTNVHSDWDFSNYDFDLLLILKKPVTEWTYSDMLYIEFKNPEIFNHLDFSKLDPGLLCKFFSFFKSTNLSDIRFTIPEKYIGYVLDNTGTIVPKEFEPYHLECMNNIIIDWKLVDPVMLKEVQEILPLVLDNTNADPTLVAKLLRPDIIDVTRKVLLEFHGIHPSLIELHISPEILELAQEIVLSGVV